MPRSYLLALDIGTSSIGHVAFALDENKQPTDILDLGVRIFPEGRDPKTKIPLAVDRRAARGLRRNRDRGQNRVRRLTNELIQFGLLPVDDDERKTVFDTISPYEARVQALHGTVEAHILGRAIAHLGRRRGFKSNRLADNEEETAFKEKIAELRSNLGDGTLGEYLLARLRENDELKRQKRPQDQQVVRFRSGETEFYADRQMYEDEFARIRATQGNSLLTDEQWDALHETVFWQYPLRPVPKGKCRFYPEENRAHADLPLTHRYRIATEVNALKYESQGGQYSLDERQRQMLYELLDHNKTITFKSLPKKKDEHKSPYFPPDATFNLDVSSRSGKLYGNRVLCDLRKPEYLGQLADKLKPERLNDIIEYLIEPITQKNGRDVVLETPELEAWLHKELPELSGAQIHLLCRYRFKRDTASVSRKFMRQMLPILYETGHVYSDAVEYLGDMLGNDLHHSDFRSGEYHHRLPYYGKVMPESVWGAQPEADKDKAPEERDDDAYWYGKIANPTVHIALNQLRVVVNRVIDKLGDTPVKIHVELTRDLKNSQDAKKKIEQAQTRNKQANDRIRKMLEDEHGFSRVSREDFQRVKLWEELGKQGARFCVFSGKSIGFAQLFSGEVEIEHIIPFSRCYDDGMGNKTLAFKSANKRKGNRTPHEAFGGTPEYDAIMRRALKSFGQGSKYNRFKEGALEAFYGQDKGGDMIARQLNDTKYMSRKARQYLSCVTGSIDAVVPVNGRLTAVLRNVWQLNHFKDKESGHYRDDHRHHIVDAFVVGLTSRALIQKLSTRRSGQEQTEDDLYHFIKNRADDIPALKSELLEKLEHVIVSYKPDHGHNGSMFNDTAYGIEHDDEGNQWCVTRKPVEALSHDEIFRIRGQRIQKQLLAFLSDGRPVENKKELVACLPGKKDLAEKAKAFTARTGVKKVRINIPNNSVEPIPSAPYKGYARNSYAYCDVWQIPKKKDKKTGKWSYEYKGAFVAYADVSKYEMNPKRPVDKHGRSHPAAKRLMRLYKDDCLRLTDKLMDDQEIVRVAGYKTQENKLDLQPHLKADSGKQQYRSINTIFGSKIVNKLSN